MNSRAEPTEPDPSVLVSSVERFLSLVEDSDHQGLALLRELRLVLAELYVGLVTLPGTGIGPAMTTRLPDALYSEDEVSLRADLAGRMPPSLYWTALRPLTWETVGSSGTELLAGHIIELRHELRNLLNSAADASRPWRQKDAQAWRVPPSLLIYSLQREVPTLGRAILDPLAILQEVVSDLDAYDAEDRSLK